MSIADMAREVRRAGIKRQDRVALAARGRHPSVAASRLGLPARPGLQGQGRAHPGPLRRPLERSPPARRRVRHLNGRENQHPGPPAYPRVAADRAPPSHARRTRVRAHGAWAYLAAWDVHRAKIHGLCERKTGIAPFGRLLRHVMTQEPYRSARRVFWTMDNGSPHRGPGLRRAHPGGMADHRSGPHARTCQLAESGGDLFLHPAAQGLDAQ